MYEGEKKYQNTLGHTWLAVEITITTVRCKITITKITITKITITTLRAHYRENKDWIRGASLKA